ncbi:MAG TPA: hypothetical protein VGB57_01955, partial [Allosphingosinicella sp.]
PERQDPQLVQRHERSGPACCTKATVRRELPEMASVSEVSQVRPDAAAGVQTQKWPDEGELRPAYFNLSE